MTEVSTATDIARGGSVPASDTGLEGPDLGAGPQPNAGPVGPQGRTRQENRSDRRSAEDALRTSERSYRDLANDAIDGDDAAKDTLSVALTGMTYQELSEDSGQKDIFDSLLKDMADGEIRPDIEVAEQGDIEMSSEDTLLPENVSGAFVPGKDGGPGTILIARNALESGDQVASEEIGEAIAAHAQNLGLEVHEGDAGARMSLAASGEAFDGVDGLFQASPDDAASVRLDGEIVEAKALLGIPGVIVPDILDELPDIVLDPVGDGSIRPFGPAAEPEPVPVAEPIEAQPGRSEAETVHEHGDTPTPGAGAFPEDLGWDVQFSTISDVSVFAKNQNTGEWDLVWSKKPNQYAMTTRVPGSAADYGPADQVAFKVVNHETGGEYGHTHPNASQRNHVEGVGQRISFEDEGGQVAQPDFDDVIITAVNPGETTPFPALPLPVTPPHAEATPGVDFAGNPTQEFDVVPAGPPPSAASLAKADTLLSEYGTPFAQTQAFDHDLLIKAASPHQTMFSTMARSFYQSPNGIVGDDFSRSQIAAMIDDGFLKVEGNVDGAEGTEALSIVGADPNAVNPARVKYGIETALEGELSDPGTATPAALTPEHIQHVVENLFNAAPFNGPEYSFIEEVMGVSTVDFGTPRIYVDQFVSLYGQNKIKLIPSNAAPGADATSPTVLMTYDAEGADVDFTAPTDGLPASRDAAVLWEPDNPVTVLGADIPAMTAGAIVNALQRTSAAGVNVSNEAVAHALNIHGTMGDDGVLYATEEDLTAMVELGTLDEVIAAASDPAALAAVTAHEKEGFWETAWGDIENASEFIGNVAEDIAEISVTDVAKFLNNELTAIEHSLKGLEKVADAVELELKASLEGGEGLFFELAGALGDNPELTAQGAAYLSSFQTTQDEAKQEAGVGLIMAMTGMSDSDAAEILHQVAMMEKVSATFFSGTAEEREQDIYQIFSDLRGDALAQLGIDPAQFAPDGAPAGDAALSRSLLQVDSEPTNPNAPASAGSFSGIPGTDRFDVAVDFALPGLGSESAVGSEGLSARAFFTIPPKATEAGGNIWQFRIRLTDTNLVGESTANGSSINAGTIGIHDIIFDFVEDGNGTLVDTDTYWSSTTMLAAEGTVAGADIPGAVTGIGNAARRAWERVRGIDPRDRAEGVQLPERPFNVIEARPDDGPVPEPGSAGGSSSGASSGPDSAGGSDDDPADEPFLPGPPDDSFPPLPGFQPDGPEPADDTDELFNSSRSLLSSTRNGPGSGASTAATAAETFVGALEVMGGVLATGMAPGRASADIGAGFGLTANYNIGRMADDGEGREIATIFIAEALSTFAVNAAARADGGSGQIAHGLGTLVSTGVDQLIANLGPISEYASSSISAGTWMGLKGPSLQRQPAGNDKPIDYGGIRLQANWEPVFIELDAGDKSGDDNQFVVS